MYCAIICHHFTMAEHTIFGDKQRLRTFFFIECDTRRLRSKVPNKLAKRLERTVMFLRNFK